jgi:hypothetical protein
VPPQGLIEWHIEVIAAGQALMIIDERSKHLRVVISAEDALEDGVETVTEHMSRHEVDQPDVRPAGDVMLAQHVPAQVVLPDDRKVPTAVPSADLRGRR